jgi:hypothetical protein
MAACGTSRRRRGPIAALMRTESDPTTMSLHGTSVWTGRALQAGSDDLKIIGLALLYPALEWSVRAPGHHGYPRASVLIRV